MDQLDNHYLRAIVALKDAPIFKNLNSEILETLLSIMTRETWVEGTLKEPKKTAPINFYFILSGKLKIYLSNSVTGRELTLYLLKTGDVFDVLCLLDNKAHEVYLEALEEVEVLKMPIESMRKWLVAYPAINRNMISYLGQRMRLLEANAFDISSCNTLIRLSRLLLNNMNVDSHKLEAINNLSNEEIANLIGTTRAVLNRHIQELKLSGAISVKRKEIQIKNIETLLDMATQKQL